MSEANILLEKRQINRAKNLFEKVVQYFTYCYNKILTDDVKINQKNLNLETALAFENHLKWHLVLEKKKKNRTNYEIQEISEFEYRCEPAELYKSDKTHEDKIDIQVSNLNFKWQEIDRELIYFAFECKRLQGISKNNEYITDIYKFVTREYKFRFPFTGMIGFVEKSKKTIPEIVADIELKLSKNSEIKSFKIENKILNKFQIQNFDYSYLSKHQHNTLISTIEVYHLFMNYSIIIQNQ